MYNPKTIATWIDRSQAGAEITLDKVMEFSGYRYNSTRSSILNEIYAQESLGLIATKRKANGKKFMLITRL